MDKKVMLGHKIRRLRKENSLTQIDMAEMLSISPSYLNLIEHNQRPVTVPLLFRLGQAFEIDLRDFAEDEDQRLAAGLREVFSDGLFEGEGPKEAEIRELAALAPHAAEAVLQLYDVFRATRDDLQGMAQQLADPDKMQSIDLQVAPVEELRDFFQSNSNHFPELEETAQALWADAGLREDALYGSLVDYLSTAFGVTVRIMPADVMAGTLRRYDYHRRRVLLSENLNLSGRLFQLSAQIGLLGHRDQLDRIIEAAGFASEDTTKLARVGLAGYFAGAVMMPYERFLNTAKDVRYDLEILQNRFSASFEQICHRLTTLQRTGNRGVSFFFIRVDHAGNVSKRLSGGGFHFARFGGNCPRWVLHDAFINPGRILSQVSAMPDGTNFLTIARTVDPLAVGYQGEQPRLAIAVGCDIKQAKQLIYGDAYDLKEPAGATPIGVSCRVCERTDCALRAHPSLNQRLKLDENVRRVAAFSTS
jgi:predicted transcriptional regulator/DNA-binding XRE family transcriptional regulator